MSSALAKACKAACFCTFVIGGTSITLPTPKVSFAAQPPSGPKALEQERRADVSALVGIRAVARPANAKGEVRKPSYGILEAAGFVSKPHTGTLSYGSYSITLPYDEASDTYAFGPMRLRHALVETIVHAAYLTGVDPRLLMAIADKESSFMVSARAQTSTARGLFQFIDSTWLRAMRDYGPRFGLHREASLVEFRENGPTIADEKERERVLGLRNDPFLSTLLAASMLRAEQEKLAGRLGRPISDAEVYLVHFLGPMGAQKFLSVLADKPKTLAANLLPQAAKANKPIFFATKKRKPQSLSVAQVHEKIGTSLERRLVRYRDLDFGTATAYAPAHAAQNLRSNPFAHWKL